MTLPQKQLYDKSNTAIQPIVERFIDNSGVIKTWNDLHEADEDGWIIVNGNFKGGNTVSVWLDNVHLCNTYTNGNIEITIPMIIPVKKGQKYKATGGIDSQSLYFMKCK